MKAYIAGKITGDSTYREKFQRAQKALEGEGFIVLNPAELPEGMLASDYMRICFAMMECADVVAFLPDYDQSRGARLEFDWCQYTGKQTMFLESMSFYREATFTDDSDCAEFNQAVEDKPMTNADRIRAMSDEELAVFLSRDLKQPCVYCQLAVFEGACTETLCDDAMMKWIQQPAEG